jgi:putative PEP-CTERM system histidine kinase
VNSSSLLAFAAAFFSCAIGLAVIVRERHSISRWYFFAGMVLLGVESAFGGISLGDLPPKKIEFWQNLALFARSVSPSVWICFSLTYSRGNYREFLARWRPILVVAFLLPVAVLFELRSKLVDVLPYLGPGQGWWLSLSGPAKAFNVFFLIATVLILMNLERTFRSAVGTMRWRIKFLVLGLGVIFGARFYTRSQALIFSGHELALTSLETGALLIGCVLIATAYVRSGFSEIDVYPSRAVLHTSVTVLLAGAYLSFVGVLARIAVRFGGAAGFRLATFVVLVGVVVLTIFLLSDRVRQRIQLFVSRHFKRPQHDFRQIWTRFTLSMSNVFDGADLCHAASRLVSETFNALSVSIWLFNEQRDRLIQTSSTSDAKQVQAEEPAREIAAKELNSIGGEKLSRPFEIEKAKGTWAQGLKGLDLARFRTGGNRICVPLLTGEHLLGLMILADRVSGLPYTTEEMDLLKCIGDQVAASLMNVELTKEKMAGRELEAFQTISAFFVHDLKNAASTLSLMLQNLPAHFDNPSFRQDTLRGIGSTVDRINHIISRLSAFRHEPQLKLREVDLNLLLTESLRSLDGTLHDKLVTTLDPIPKIVADREQLQSAIVNLLLNARDAIASSGHITVETRQEAGWVVLSIADNGCGMSPAFVKDSLFRPFRTTKKKGLGIGMFQAKTIIEAHRGRIQVTSNLGLGTTFHVMLPLKTSG